MPDPTGGVDRAPAVDKTLPDDARHPPYRGGRHAGWTRDAAVVWHGFTQMAAYPENAPIIVERAEGRELIDVEGRRYFDAISSLWVTTLGHRVPELDQAVVDQLGRVAHATLLGNGNTAAVEFAEALARVVPVDDPHVLFASDGAVAVEQALKIAFQYWINRGSQPAGGSWPSGTPTTATRSEPCRSGTAGSAPPASIRCGSRWSGRPGMPSADWAAKLVACVESEADTLAAVVLEPLVQGASGMLVAEPADLALVGEACRAHGVLLVCDEVATGFGRTGRLFASEWGGPSFRPDLLCLGKGISGGYLPLSATVAVGRRLRGLQRRRPRTVDLLPRPFLWRECPCLRGGHAASGAHRGVGRAGPCRRGRRAPLGPPGRLRRRSHRGGGGPSAGPDGGRRARSAGRRRPLGAAGLRRGRVPGCAAPPPRGRGGGDAAAHHHCRGDRPRRRRPGRIDRRGGRRDGAVIGASLPGRTGSPVMTGPRGTGRSPWSEWVEGANRAVAASGRWRRPTTFDAAGPTGRLDDGDVPGGRPVVSFASNDYLGLASHPAVVAAAHRALDRWGTGSGGSRLITGSRPIHAQLERALAAWKQCERALVFPTGFAANLSVLAVFGAEDAHIFSDELNHASIVDGCRLARAPVTVYPHGRLDRLDAVLAATAAARPIIVSDSVFSMDGDEADLAGLLAVARRHGALLVLDEAHAVLGPELDAIRPDAIRSDAGNCGADVLQVGTLSKTLGSLGGFVAGPARFTDHLVNRARPYIFTTAPTPADAAAALAALEVVRSAEGEAAPGPAGRSRGAGGGRGRTSPTTAPRSSRWWSGPRPTRSTPRTGSWPAGCGSRPSALRPSPRGPPGCGSPSRPSTPTSRWTGWWPGWPRAGWPRPGWPTRGPVRPERLVLVCGTGTDVGKTWVCSQLLGELRRRGVTVAARKPAQSFDVDADRGTPGRADRRRGAGRRLGRGARRGLPLVALPTDRAMAPPMAAEALGLPPFSVADLVGELRWPTERVQVGVVELAGGVRSPQAADGDVTDLAAALAARRGRAGGRRRPRMPSTRCVFRWGRCAPDRPALRCSRSWSSTASTPARPPPAQPPVAGRA